MKNTLLSIAGFDPSGGAGILLDIQVFRSFSFSGAGIPTALTIQNSRRVEDFYSPPPDFLLRQYDMLAKDMPLKGIKVGMVGTRRNLDVITRILKKNSGKPIVIDPVLKSSSGTWLIEKNAVAEYAEAFRGTASLITPNLEEASLLSGIPVKDTASQERATLMLFKRFQCPCLIKGGHFSGEKTDMLYDGTQLRTFSHAEAHKDVHGTGCFLSSSLVALLVRGHPLDEACSLAVQWTHEAILQALPAGSSRTVITVPLSFSPLLQPGKGTSAAKPDR